MIIGSTGLNGLVAVVMFIGIALLLSMRAQSSLRSENPCQSSSLPASFEPTRRDRNAVLGGMGDNDEPCRWMRAVGRSEGCIAVARMKRYPDAITLSCLAEAPKRLPQRDSETTVLMTRYAHRDDDILVARLDGSDLCEGQRGGDSREKQGNSSCHYCPDDLS